MDSEFLVKTFIESSCPRKRKMPAALSPPRQFFERNAAALAVFLRPLQGFSRIADYEPTI
jgi:hypothetical protein